MGPPVGMCLYRRGRNTSSMRGHTSLTGLGRTRLEGSWVEEISGWVGGASAPRDFALPLPRPAV